MKILLKHLYVSSLLMLTSFYLSAQAPAIEWQKCLGGSQYEGAFDIQITADGGYIVTGFSNSNDGDVSGNNGGNDFWVTKLDNTGSILWQSSLGGSGTDQSYEIHATDDGGYIVAGMSQSYLNDGDVTGHHGGLFVSDYWVVKLDGSGTLQWQKCFGGSTQDWAYTIKPTPDGGCIMAGDARSQDGDISDPWFSGADYWIVKLDDTGALQWEKTLGGQNDERVHAIQLTPDGGYIFAGSTSSNDGDVTFNHGGADFWVVKTDSLGTIQWQKSLGGSGVETANDIQLTPDGGYIVAGMTDSTDGDVSGFHGIEDGWIVKLDSIGTLQWQRALGGSSYESANHVQVTPDGGYIVAGYARSEDGDVAQNIGFTDFWVVRLDLAGNIQWEKTMGGSAGDQARAVRLTADGGFIVAGTTGSTNWDVSGNHGNYDTWLVKLAPDVVLPLHLLNFTSKFQEYSFSVLLQWETTQQENLSHFEIERATDGIQFSNIGHVAAVKNNLSDNHPYPFTDKSPQPGKNYYRLKMKDIDGGYSYSPVTSIQTGNDLTTQIFPNPAHNSLQVQMTVDKEQATHYRMYAMHGHIVLQGVLNTKKGYNLFTLPLSGLAAGNYMLHMNNGIKKMITKQ